MVVLSFHHQHLFQFSVGTLRIESYLVAMILRTLGLP